jgi:ABC-type branched-subunit amino acid transport system substrate-binding protein
MTSLDSRNAHLAEQVATKTRIAMLSSWATEMSLSEAFVPWYYRCIPNDHQQAAALAREIYGTRKYSKVVTIATATHDARLAAGVFVEVAASRQHEVPRQYTCDTSGKELPEILASIEKLGMEAIVLFGDPAFAADIMPMLKQRGMNQRIFGTLALSDGQKATGPDWNNLEGITLVSSQHWFTEEGMAFQEAFRKVFGYQPGAAAAFAYDGIQVILDVIRRGGAERDGIIKAFGETDFRSGITGSIQFNAQGNRSGKVGLMTVRKGKPYKLAT